MFEWDMDLQMKFKDLIYAYIYECVHSDAFKSILISNQRSNSVNFTLTLENLPNNLKSLGIYKMDVRFVTDTSKPLVEQVILYTNMKILEFIEMNTVSNKSLSYGSSTYSPRNNIDGLFGPNYCYIMVDKRGYKFKRPVHFFLSDYIEYSLNFEPYHGMLLYGNNYHFNDLIWVKYYEKGLYLNHSSGIMRMSIPFPLSDVKSLNYFMKLTESDRLFGVRYNILLYYDNYDIIESLYNKVARRGIINKEITLMMNDSDYVNLEKFNNYFNLILN